MNMNKWVRWTLIAAILGAYGVLCYLYGQKPECKESLPREFLNGSQMLMYAQHDPQNENDPENE